MANTSTKEKVYDKELVLHWLEEMLRIRKFEEKASQLYMQQKFRGFCRHYAQSRHGRAVR